MSTITFVDLFCGAGGLSLGFQNAGMQSVRAIDSNMSAIATYNQNFQDHISHEQINENTVLPIADIIIGGPPCQGFSSAGLRRSNDRRNTLVSVFAELVANQKPKAFVFENVEGFLTADNGNRVFDLINPLIQIGYRIHLRKVNAANYGVPQHRKRVIAVGGFGWNPTFPEPTHMAYGAPGTKNINKHLPRCPSLSDALLGLPEPTETSPGVPVGHYLRSISEQDLERIKLLKSGQSMKDLPQKLWHKSFRKRAYRRVMDGTPTERRGGAPYGLRRLKENEPSKAITSGAITEFVHPTENRFLTLRECARIQTFPDDFVFIGSPSDVILQIGNAVPPRLGENIAFSLKKDLLADSFEEYSHGALLSFLPTHSEGMSPALRKLSERVEQQYLKTTEMDQLELWH